MSPEPPRLLDLFCGALGAGEGYRRAGWDVTGVDFVVRQHRPPGITVVRADVRDVLADLDYLRSFDAVHASPPCKVHTRLGHLMAAQGVSPTHGDLVGVTRDALERAGVRYVIENVEGAPMRPDVMLCGSMFGLSTVVEGRRRWLKRHRLFELGGWGNHGVGIQPECFHDPRSRPIGVYGSIDHQIPAGGQSAPTLESARELMGMGWASWAGITQAIPPAYTHYLGTHLAAEIVDTVAR